MRLFLQPCLYAFMFYSVCFSQVFCQEDTKEVLSDAIRGQRKLKQIENSLAKWECAITNKQNGIASKMSAIVKANQNSRLLQYGDIITCFTPEYTFSIKKNSSKNAWTLSKFIKGNSEVKWLSSHGELASAVHPLLYYGSPFTTSENSNAAPEYQLLSVRKLSDSVSELTLRFDTKSQFTNKASQHTAVCQFSVPMNYFITSITTHSVTPGSKVHPDRTTSIKSEVVQEATKILVNKITKSSKISGEVSPDLIEIYDFNYHYNEQVNPSEFTLEFYGITLPTDDVYENRGFNWPLWGCLGVGCIVLSLLLAWIVRRRNRLKAGD